MPEEIVSQFHSAVPLGLLLLASLLAGILADLVRIPKVSAYLLAGMLVGPSLAHWISEEQLHHLAPVTKLAMALVLLELGYQFPLVQLRSIMRRALWLSAGEIIATFTLVSVGVLVLGGGLALAVLLGALALATAPATTVLVLKESNSEGPVTDLAEVLVALNNIVAIIAFEILFLIAHVSTGAFEGVVIPEIGKLAYDLGGACLLGLSAGLVISYGSGLLSRTRWLVMVFAVAVLTLGLCESWNMPYMLAFLLAGMVVVNTSDSVPDLLSEQAKVAGLLIVMFFAVHGAELQLTAFFAAGALGTGYILTRSAGKILGIRWAARFSGETPAVRRFLGSCMLAQAGAAIALASLAEQRWPEVGKNLQAIILGSVVFFEIVGPIMIRWSLLKSGELPFSHAISHTDRTMLGELSGMLNRGLLAIGINPWQKKTTSEVQIDTMMQRNFKTLSASASFDKTVDFIEHSRDNTYTVVAEDDAIVGIIRFGDLRDEHFDPELGGLVCAIDLARQSFPRLYPDAPIAEAWTAFLDNNFDILPVISRASPHVVVGMIRRRDIVSLLAVKSRDS